MGGFSSLILVLFNVITMILGLVIAGAGSYLATRNPGECLQYLHSPLLVLGVFIAAASLMALVGACFRISIVLRLYLLLMFLMILACVGFAIFSFVVTHKTAAKALANVTYKQYRVGDYSTWLQTHIQDPITWGRIRACINDSKMCFFGYISQLAMLDKAVTYLAADTVKGCCVPPDICQFQSNTGVYYLPANPGADSDCTTYDNAINTRCFYCNSCPAGVMQSIAINWKNFAIALCGLAGILLVIYCVGCQAL